MKKIVFVIIIFLITLFLFSNCLRAQAPPPPPTQNGYLIESLDSQIDVNQDTSLTVTETINTTFYGPKHGIFRTIPVIYSAGGKTIKAKFQILSVTDINNQSLPFEVSRFHQSVKIKIGDPNKTLTGRHTYHIKYQINDVLLRYKDHDEIYWNVTGHEWDTSINKSAAIVNSPFAKISKITCHKGIFGSKATCNSTFDDKTAFFSNYSPLNPGEDFTIVVALDKNNQLKFPGPLARLFNLLTDNWGYLAALTPLTILFILWFKKGRDLKYLSDNVYIKPDQEKTTTVSLFAREHLPMVYSPINGLSPSTVGTIIDEKVDTKDIVAEIVELARLGYLKIVKIEKKKFLGKDTDYLFYKQSKNTSNLKDYQQFLLEKLFTEGVEIKDLEKILKSYPDLANKFTKQAAFGSEGITSLSCLKDHFYQHLETFKKKLYFNLVQEKIFTGPPQAIKALWLFMHILMMVAGFAFVAYFADKTGNAGPVFLLFLTIVPAVFIIKNMPQRTAWGHSLYRQIVGLRYFLDKGKWREEIAEKNLFFEEILPLAIALGLVHKLAKDMEGLGIEPPSYLNGFVATSFAHDLDHFSSQTAGTLTSSPGKSWSGKSSWTGGSGFSGGGGGGSSGGGFGGGGGGSW